MKEEKVRLGVSPALIFLQRPIGNPLQTLPFLPGVEWLPLLVV